FLQFLIGQRNGPKAPCLFNQLLWRTAFDLNYSYIGLDVTNRPLQLIGLVDVRFRNRSNITTKRIRAANAGTQDLIRQSDERVGCNGERDFEVHQASWPSILLRRSDRACATFFPRRQPQP